MTSIPSLLLSGATRRGNQPRHRASPPPPPPQAPSRRLRRLTTARPRFTFRFEGTKDIAGTRPRPHQLRVIPKPIPHQPVEHTHLVGRLQRRRPRDRRSHPRPALSAAKEPALSAAKGARAGSPRRPPHGATDVPGVCRNPSIVSESASPYTSLFVPRSTVTVSKSDRVCPSTATNFAVNCVLVTLTNRYP